MPLVEWEGRVNLFNGVHIVERSRVSSTRVPWNMEN